MADSPRLYERAATEAVEFDALWDISDGRTFFTGPLYYNAAISTARRFFSPEFTAIFACDWMAAIGCPAAPRLFPPVSCMSWI
jgi:hypothetical protein